MSGALETLRQAVAAALNAGGVNAVAAMEPEARRRWDGPVAAVSLAGVECGPGGFQHYLGVWKNPDTGLEEEVYGRKAQFTLDLDLYAPRSGGRGPAGTPWPRPPRSCWPAGPGDWTWRSWRRTGWSSWPRTGCIACPSGAGARAGWWPAGTAPGSLPTLR